MLTKSETVPVGVTGTQTITLPAALAGGVVVGTEYGSVSRDGTLLQGSEVLAAGDMLTFTSDTAGGTTWLNVRLDNAEFDGDFNNLDNKPEAGVGLTTIATDNTLSGDGTSAKPLGVSSTLVGLPDRVAALESKPATTSLTFSTDLIAIGDSVTAGYMSGPAVQDYGGSAWPAVIGTIRAWAVINYGIDGSELVSGGSSGAHPMVDRVANAVSSGFAGHVALFGGTNDYNTSQPLGTPGSTDTHTVYGALLVSGRRIMAQAPDCLLHLITPLWRGDSGRAEGTYNSASYTLEQVRQAMRDTAAQLEREYPGHIQLHDAGRELHDWLAAPNNVYMAADNLHLSAAGETLLGQHLAMQMLGQNGAADTPPVVTPTPTPTNALYARTFADFAAENLDGQDDWTAYNGAQATCSGSGLSLYAPFASNPRGVLHALPAGATRIQGRFLLTNSGTGNGSILRAVHQLSDDMALCVWVFLNGSGRQTIDWGLIQGNTVTSWIGEGGPTAAPDCMVEITLSGSQVELRYWDAQTGTRPDAAQYMHTAPTLTPDAFGLSSIGSAPQTVKSVAVY